MLVQPSRGKFHNIATREQVHCAGVQALVVLYACADYKFLRGFVRMRGVNCRSVCRLSLMPASVVLTQYSSLVDRYIIVLNHSCILYLHLPSTSCKPRANEMLCSVTPRSSGRIAVNSVLALWKCELGSTVLTGHALSCTESAYMSST